MSLTVKSGEIFTEINITPLTDVFLVLVVVMILVAPLVNSSVLKVDPPSASSQAQSEPDKGPKINVRVSAQGQVFVNDRDITPVDTKTVQAALEEAQQASGEKDIPLILSSDAEALQKYVVAVMDAAAGAGISKMRVMPLTGN
jgi:biopolymer transport protein ExbD